MIEQFSRISGYFEIGVLTRRWDPEKVVICIIEPCDREEIGGFGEGYAAGLVSSFEQCHGFHSKQLFGPGVVRR